MFQPARGRGWRRPWVARTARLSLLDHLDDLRKIGLPRPVALTSIVTAPDPFMAPPITTSPGFFETGRDSPVSIASLKEDSPSAIAPVDRNLWPPWAG